MWIWYHFCAVQTSVKDKFMKAFGVLDRFSNQRDRSFPTPFLRVSSTGKFNWSASRVKIASFAEEGISIRHHIVWSSDCLSPSIRDMSDWFKWNRKLELEISDASHRMNNTGQARENSIGAGQYFSCAPAQKGLSLSVSRIRIYIQWNITY